MFLFVLYAVQAFIIEQALSAYKKVRRLKYKTLQSLVHSTKNKNNRQRYKYNGNIRRLTSEEVIIIP